MRLSCRIIIICLVSLTVLVLMPLSGLAHSSADMMVIARDVLLILIPILFILGILGIWFLKRENVLKTKKLIAQMDMTRQNEDQLRRERNFLDRIMETSPTGIVRVEVSGKLVYANERAEEILGIQSENIFKTYEDPAWKITDFYGQIVPVENLPFNMVKNTHSPVYDIRHAIQWPDGRRVFLSINASPLFDESDTFDGMVAILEDITGKIEFEKIMFQAQKMESIGTLAGGIAHDFNNILFPIIGHTEMLLEDVSKDSPLRDSLNEIYGSTLRARDLVAQILAFSRQGKNELKLMKMQPIIKEVLKLIRSTIPATISIHQDLQANCGLVEADPTRIHQIVMNLTTNAYHAMQENGGKLDVKLKQIQVNTSELTGPDMVPGLYACLIIADTGTGMDKQTMDKIFDPFFTTKEQGKGTGMGLSVVHGIVKNMNGAIKVFSEPGKGSEFHVFLPIAQGICDMPEKHEKMILQGGTETLMLIDDEKSIVTVEKNALERLGYQVISFETSIDALMAFRSDPDQFDMVISDIAMPNIPGDKLATELIKIRPDIPILLCTGFSENMSEEKTASIGVRGFLLKPIIIKDLATKIRQILDDPSGREKQHGQY